jgi:hypothetical protein
VNDVDGSGDSYCSFMVSSGFRLRAHLAGGTVVSGPQMTASYFGGQDNVKRIAFPLGASHPASDVKSIELDAYDGDGMYFLELGDAFIPKPIGDNGADLAVVHAGATAVNRYVDDDDSGCTNGVNSGGPNPPYPCVGGSTAVAVP